MLSSERIFFTASSTPRFVHASERVGSFSGTSCVSINSQMRETRKGRGPGEIAQRYQMDPVLCEQIARLYVTHPGVTPEGIMAKMGL